MSVTNNGDGSFTIAYTITTAQAARLADAVVALTGWNDSSGHSKNTAVNRYVRNAIVDIVRGREIHNIAVAAREDYADDDVVDDDDPPEPPE